MKCEGGREKEREGGRERKREERERKREEREREGICVESRVRGCEVERCCLADRFGFESKRKKTAPRLLLASDGQTLLVL